MDAMHKEERFRDKIKWAQIKDMRWMRRVTMGWERGSRRGRVPPVIGRKAVSNCVQVTERLWADGVVDVDGEAAENRMRNQ